AIGLTSFIVYWITFEFLHLNWELTWPWLTLGNAFASMPQIVQWYEYTGVLGGSLWILLGNVAIFYFFRQKTISGIHRFRKNSIWPIAFLIIIPSVISMFMYYNYQEQGEETEVVVVQPNIDPYEEKFYGGERFIPYE